MNLQNINFITLQKRVDKFHYIGYFGGNRKLLFSKQQ